jgi:hypothetical protein
MNFAVGVFRTLHHGAGAEKHAVVGGSTCLDPQQGPLDNPILRILLIFAPATKAPHRRNQLTADTDISSIHIRGTAGQQGNEWWFRKYGLLKHPAHYRGCSTISAIDRQHLNLPPGQCLQRRRNVGRGVSHDMMDRWLPGN